MSVTTVPLGPRTFLSASSEVCPSTVTPSIAAIRSPGRRPTVSAGLPGTVPTTISPQAGPSGEQPSVPSFARYANSATVALMALGGG